MSAPLRLLLAVTVPGRARAIVGTYDQDQAIHQAFLCCHRPWKVIELWLVDVSVDELAPRWVRGVWRRPGPALRLTPSSRSGWLLSYRHLDRIRRENKTRGRLAHQPCTLAELATYLDVSKGTARSLARAVGARHAWEGRRVLWSLPAPEPQQGASC